MKMEQELSSPIGSSYQNTNKHFPGKIWLPLLAQSIPGRSSAAVLLLVVLLCSGAFFSIRLLDSSRSFNEFLPQKLIFSSQKSHNSTSPQDNAEKSLVHKPKKKVEIPLNCSIGVTRVNCPANYYPSKYSSENTNPTSDEQPRTCPDYFRWIHDDLWPWRETGITESMVEAARRTANFRLVILNGRAYVETYQKSFQTRDTFTLWGILQLLRRYPGQIPDLDLMFDCVDWPVVRKDDFIKRPDPSTPPPLFRYCGNDDTFDIVFPDWSFWGWPEINIKPWEPLSEDLREGNRRISWLERKPYAYWKGNPIVAKTREDLLKCNVSETKDWGARVYAQDWIKEQQQGYKQSDLASQCIHRFKIYIEGSAWSVSEKYILACNSLTLLVQTHYYDFFTRSLMPLQHYWPVKDEDKCRSIKHAVEWGNRNPEKAQEIGQTASRFILDELKMDNVYDYMFHLLTEYSKLLKYKPTIPPKAVELCSEAMVCPAGGLEKKFMEDSIVKGPHTDTPCSLPSPYGPASLHTIIERRESSIAEVGRLEKQYWNNTS